MLRTETDSVALRDGASITIRPIRPDDKDAIVGGFEGLGPESRYRRFFAPLHRLGERDLAYLTEVDHRDHEALIAFSEAGEPLGVARYVRGDDPDRAEVAVAVVDEWQGRGVGTALLSRLADRAREEHVKAFTATVLAENRDSLAFLDSFGDTRRVGSASNTVELEMELPQRGLGERLWSMLREAARGALSGREPSHPRTRLRRRT